MDRRAHRPQPGPPAEKWSHNQCKACFESEGVCWRDEVVRRYRRYGAHYREPAPGGALRGMRTVLLAPVMGALAGGALSSWLWLFAQSAHPAADLLAVSSKFWRG